VTVFNSPDLDRRFARDGFVVARLMDAEEAEAARAQCRARLPAAMPACENVTYIYTDEPELAWIDELVGPIFDRSLLPLLRKMQRLHSSVIVKPAGERAVPPHVHPIFTLEQTQNTVFCWCALEDMVDANGVMEVLPGSHKLFPIMPMYNREPYFLPAWDEVCARMEPIYLKAGEALLFDESLIHASKANLTKDNRLALATHCIAADLEPIALFPADAGQFRVYATGRDFGYQYHIRPEQIDPPAHWTLLGYVDDVHRQVAADEFLARLDSDERIAGTFELVDKRQLMIEPRPALPSLRDRARRVASRLFHHA
jgi:hypothetical protein